MPMEWIGKEGDRTSSTFLLRIIFKKGGEGGGTDSVRNLEAK